MSNISIDVSINRSIDVVYHVDGKYRPATHLDPPEYPEVKLESVKYKNRELIKVLSSSQKDNLIEYIEQNEISLY